MKTLHTRLYTNLILTAVAVLLAAWLLAPYAHVPQAQAQATYTPTEKPQQTESTDSTLELARAQRAVADSNREIARALRDLSKSVDSMARSQSRSQGDSR